MLSNGNYSSNIPPTKETLSLYKYHSQDIYICRACETELDSATKPCHVCGNTDITLIQAINNTPSINTNSHLNSDEKLNTNYPERIESKSDSTPSYNQSDKDSSKATVFKILLISAVIVTILSLIGAISHSSNNDNNDSNTTQQITTEKTTQAKTEKTTQTTTEATQRKTTEATTEAKDDDKERYGFTIAINTTENDWTTNNNTISYGTSILYFHATISYGPTWNSSIKLYGVLTDPLGDYTYEVDRLLTVGEGFWISDYTEDGTALGRGTYTFNVYNAYTDELLASQTVTIE